MNRERQWLAFVSLAVVCSALSASPARAANPSIADCLASSEAAIQLGNQHRLRAERSQLLVCSAASCPADIRRECLRKVDEVTASLPTIIFEARDAAGQDLSAVKVSFDAQLLAEKLDGAAIAIDPGEHTFTFETAGQPTVERRLLIREAQKDRHETITFGPAPAPSPPINAAPPSVAAAPPTAATSQSTATEPNKSRPFGPTNDAASQSANPLRVAGYFSAGFGVLALGAGTLLHVAATTANNRAEQTCTGGAAGNQCADSQDLSNHEAHVDAAKTRRTLSYLSFGVGAAALVTGVTLIVVGRPVEKPSALLFSPIVGVGTRDLGLIVSGAF